MNRPQISLWASLVVLLYLVGCVPSANADSKKELERASEDMAQNIARLNFHKIYVPDFLDDFGKRTDRSAFLGAAFSKALSEQKNNFEVLDRSSVQKSYDDLGIVLADLQNSEALVRVAQTNGADAILLGTVTKSSTNLVTLALSVRGIAAGKELFGNRYELSKDPSQDSFFPAVSDTSGRIFFFPGYDKVTLPKCTRCPPPAYTDMARRKKIQGTVLLSAVFTARGTIEQVILVQGLEQSLDQTSMHVAEGWKFTPSMNADGNPVSVRSGIENTFRLF